MCSKNKHHIGLCEFGLTESPAKSIHALVIEKGLACMVMKKTNIAAVVLPTPQMKLYTPKMKINCDFMP